MFGRRAEQFVAQRLDRRGDRGGIAPLDRRHLGQLRGPRHFADRERLGAAGGAAALRGEGGEGVGGRAGEAPRRGDQDRRFYRSGHQNRGGNRALPVVFADQGDRGGALGWRWSRGRRPAPLRRRWRRGRLLQCGWCCWWQRRGSRAGSQSVHSATRPALHCRPAALRRRGPGRCSSSRFLRGSPQR